MGKRFRDWHTTSRVSRTKDEMHRSTNVQSRLEMTKRSGWRNMNDISVCIVWDVWSTRNDQVVDFGRRRYRHV